MICKVPSVNDLSKIQESSVMLGGKNGAAPALRPLNLEDFIQSKAKVGPSVSFDAARPVSSFETSGCARASQEDVCLWLSPDILAYSTLLDGFCKQGNLDEMLVLFQEMQRRLVKPDLVVYTILINGMCKSRKVKDAKELFLDTALVDGFAEKDHKLKHTNF
uniref:Pentatricopeptide repeat-containing protein n=1 Tax=Salix viminalis TaxID=40686 RepID=A0A6N2L332_SALVM